MEAKSNIKKCDICKDNAISLCLKCMFYYCESCFKIAHSKGETQSHKKEKIDFYSPLDVRCPSHILSPMNLFCVDDRGIYYFNI